MRTTYSTILTTPSRGYCKGRFTLQKKIHFPNGNRLMEEKLKKIAQRLVISAAVFFLRMTAADAVIVTCAHVTNTKRCGDVLLVVCSYAI